MKRNDILIVECNADTVVMEMLFKPLLDVVKGEGTTVAKLLQQRPFAIAIIDDDKKKQAYFNEFQEVEYNSEFQLKRWQHPERNHHAIVLCRDIERWLYHAACSVKVQPENYGFPSDLAQRNDHKTFCKVTKPPTVRQNLQFLAFIAEIYQRQAAPMLVVQEWVHEIIDRHQPETDQ